MPFRGGTGARRSCAGGDAVDAGTLPPMAGVLACSSAPTSRLPLGAAAATIAASSFRRQPHLLFLQRAAGRAGTRRWGMQRCSRHGRTACRARLLPPAAPAPKAPSCSPLHLSLTAPLSLFATGSSISPPCLVHILLGMARPTPATMPHHLLSRLPPDATSGGGRGTSTRTRLSHLPHPCTPATAHRRTGSPAKRDLLWTSSGFSLGRWTGLVPGGQQRLQHQRVVAWFGQEQPALVEDMPFYFLYKTCVL